MLKWLVTVLVLLVVFAVIAQRFGNWRLPGDFTVPVRGRIYYIPIASTLVFSLLVWLISKVI
jgi:Protein of unknown function (DUF2905)